jgi:hypothetical protein
MPQIERLDEGVDHPNRMIASHQIVQRRRDKLNPCLSCSLTNR